MDDTTEVTRVDIGNAIIAGIVCNDEALEQMQDILRNLEKVGFVIVPKQPTKAMIYAGNKEEVEQFNQKSRYLSSARIYQSMISEWS
jgi:hypothetical protein